MLKIFTEGGTFIQMIMARCIVSWCMFTHRDYESLKVRKGVLHKEKERLQQNLNILQKQVGALFHTCV